MSDKPTPLTDALSEHERHDTVAETRYWCNQYKLQAKIFERQLSSARQQHLTPPQIYAEVDIDDEEAFESARQANDAYVGALEYQGNTVSYLVQKGKNYGDLLLEAHKASGAKPGQNLLDRIKELIAIAATRQQHFEEAGTVRVPMELAKETCYENSAQWFQIYTNEGFAGLYKAMLAAALREAGREKK